MLPFAANELLAVPGAEFDWVGVGVTRVVSTPLTSKDEGPSEMDKPVHCVDEGRWVGGYFGG